ncbi:cysteine dioxygenase [Paracidovorax anthurii]|uniref:Putative metal-dependent enzyme (Double-stranded beta helix superfamily) n=1 Tax=Paracidovorax anthurii TaxID=78229 RepID=A0A328YY77_9BURK|nr:cysteine dioxygenase [Paracidovorax anthurii]RAR78364.1 putative metal-dependent enzyme (double-stranded beta helix superfamily) [Paracidovorax anthurii]
MPRSATEPTDLAPLRHFVRRFTQLIDQRPAEPEVIERGGALLRELVARDGWLPADYARPDATRYQQYLLHADALDRFSVVSFVWGPGQSTPIHDHTVWGLIGMLRGSEDSQAYSQDAAGRWQPHGPAHRLRPGDVEAVSPTLGDVHRVSNAQADAVSVSIHVYGADIGSVRRSVYPPEGGRKPFVSGYGNATLPNLWGAGPPSA